MTGPSAQPVLNIHKRTLRRIHRHEWSHPPQLSHMTYKSLTTNPLVPGRQITVENVEGPGRCPGLQVNRIAPEQVPPTIKLFGLVVVIRTHADGLGFDLLDADDDWLGVHVDALSLPVSDRSLRPADAEHAPTYASPTTRS